MSELIDALSRSLVEKLATGLTRADTINITVNNAIHLDQSLSTTSYSSHVSQSSGVAVAQGTNNQATAGSGNTPIASAAALIDELTRLRTAMRAEATDVDHVLSVATVAEAQKAVEANDAGTVATKLRAAGSWALSIAEKVGLAAATEAIKRTIG